eukprot:TRINITY_DN259_c4_g1_i1.p1 TRINITY_DN259_c4_g1~~TRINITY_DN259_c4_g1_i1.p1  ORF type:complete len:419 (+),score=68.92 TRINITY_DN259_c4_g1_i1:46-1302(+)
MSATKRASSSVNADDRKKLRSVRGPLIEALKSGYEAAEKCLQEIDDTDLRWIMIVDLSRVVPTDSISKFISYLQKEAATVLGNEASTANFVSAVNIISKRCASDPHLQGTAACLLLRLPLTELYAAAPPNKENKEDSIAKTMSDLVQYAAGVREAASQVGGIMDYPSFASALSRVKDKTGKTDSTEDDEQCQRVVSLHERPTSILSAARHQTELLLTALVRGQAILGRLFDSGITSAKNTDMVQAISILKASVAGLSKNTSKVTTDVAICDNMREYCWKQWASGNYKNLSTIPKSTTRTNDIILPNKIEPVSSQPPKPTGFFEGSASTYEPPSLDVEDFLGVAAYHIHPDAGMEKEYLITRNPLYIWRAVRLLLSSKTLSTDFWYNEAEDFEKLVETLFPDLGQKVFDEEMAKLANDE